MNTSYGLDSYRSHDLNIMMKTSSGDAIEMDFSNKNSASIRHKEDGDSSSTSMKFSSMQSFQFNIDSNGIDENDKKEIEEFMKIAQPFIDSFMKELEEDSPKSPINKIAKDIASIFEPNKERSENSKNFVKSNIVDMFDDSMKKLELPEIEKSNIFEQAQKLLEKTLQEFKEFNKSIYA
ncbi:MAG: hypothetical protein U9N02_05560 [Campylobacterota bacterium]|nr:hypothetical protein [Campylobacterota bacterium]